MEMTLARLVRKYKHSTIEFLVEKAREHNILDDLMRTSISGLMIITYPEVMEKDIKYNQR